MNQPIQKYHAVSLLCQFQNGTNKQTPTLTAVTISTTSRQAMTSTTTTMIPSPSGNALALVSALQNVTNHTQHVQAIQLRDSIVQDPILYGPFCIQLLYIFIGCCTSCGSNSSSNNDHTGSSMIQTLEPNELQIWEQSDFGVTIRQLQENRQYYIPFGQTAGLLLKNALIRPSIHPITHQVITLSQNEAQQVQSLLLIALRSTTSSNIELQSVTTSIISSVAVSEHGIQPYLHISNWSNLVTTLVSELEQYMHALNNSVLNSAAAAATVDATSPETTTIVMNYDAAIGSIHVIQKMMEDGPGEIPEMDIDRIVIILIQILQPMMQSSSSNTTAEIESIQLQSQLSTFRILALQSLVSCLSDHIFPSSLVAYWNNYFMGLSYLAKISSTIIDTNNNNNNSNNNFIRQWVCRSIVTILQTRTEYIVPHLQELCPFMLLASSSISSNTTTTTTSNVALEACDFWLTFATLDDTVVSGTMHDIVAAYIPQLIPILLDNMIYPVEKQQELIWLNEQEQQQQIPTNQRPIFHKSKAATKHAGSNTLTNGSNDRNDDNITNDNGDDDDEDENDDTNDEYDDDDEDGWTVRKCAAATLDALSNLYGGEIILPHLLPNLEIGLQSTNLPWKQEACIMALGAIAEGCYEEMTDHMHQIYPYLMNILTVKQQQQEQLPQLKCMAAWTVGQYSVWVVEQVQSGTQGHLIGELADVLIQNLSDSNTKVQISCGAAFGVLVGSACELMAPYLEPIFTALATTLVRYQGRSLLTIIDVFGTMGECVGPAIAEGSLPAIYIPSLLHLWDALLKSSGLSTPALLRDRTIIPLMESIASIALAGGMNFQPYALDSFNNAMSIIEYVTLALAVTSDDTVIQEEDIDPLVAAADLIDSLVEGLGSNFAALLNCSPRYGPQFLNMLVTLCQHEIYTVRMSALALVGDLTRNTPQVLQPALPQIVNEVINCMDPIQPSVAINAAWSIGEICVQCKGQPSIIEPFVTPLLQNAIGLLMGNGVFDDGTTHGSTIPGLVENVAACIGRLALVNPNFLAKDLSRFLCGWCDGLGKIQDPTERRDAFTGFVQAIYANPQAITQASNNVADVMVAILFAILSWHIPEDITDANYSKLLTGHYSFIPFPSTESVLGTELVKLVQDMKLSVGENEWHIVTKRLPVNVRKLFREVYNL